MCLGFGGREFFFFWLGAGGDGGMEGWGPRERDGGCLISVNPCCCLNRILTIWSKSSYQFIIHICDRGWDSFAFINNLMWNVCKDICISLIIMSNKVINCNFVLSIKKYYDEFYRWEGNRQAKDHTKSWYFGHYLELA